MPAEIDNSKDRLEKDQIAKPSQAEGERDQPGEEQQQQEHEEDVQPAKPSQAEGERKPYT
jgi:hypothetical protein